MRSPACNLLVDESREARMRIRLAGCGLVAAMLVAGVPAMAQQGQAPKAQTPTAKSSSPTSKAEANQITLLGCVESEKDYRARLGAAKGGPLGTTVGQADE